MKLKTLLVCLIIFTVMGCAGTGKMVKSPDLDAVPAPKKFDLGQIYFKWVIMFPLEMMVGLATGILFMTPEHIDQMVAGGK